MAEAKEGAGGGGEASPTPTRSRLILKTITSTARIIISTLSPPQLLPLTNSDAHPVAQNLQNLELGKLAFTLGATATLGLLFSQKFPAAKADNLVVVGLMGGCAAVWNGILFGKKSVEQLGISLILACLYVLVGSFLPLSFSWACWLLGAFCLMPFLYLVIKPHPS